ncbi:MAG: hypothetical protein H6578_03625 [Chitinophagales bacterium]|nr:hypothetical protein [Chitinophagales bacterium]
MASLKKIVKSSAKVTLLFFIVLIIFLLGIFYAIRTPKVQTFIVQKITKSISKQLGVDIEIDNVNIEFFNKIELHKLYAKDTKNDTIFYLGDLQANFSYFSFLQKKITLKNVEANEFYLNINRAYNDSLFNINYIKLSGDNKKTTNSTATIPWDIIVRNTNFYNTKVNYNDEYGGLKLTALADTVNLDFDMFKLGNDLILLENLIVNNPNVALSLNPANPDKKKKDTHKGFYLPVKIISGNVNLTNGFFTLKNNLATDTFAADFNPNNLKLNNINLLAKKVEVGKDSLSANINSLSLNENDKFWIDNLSTVVQFGNAAIKLNDFELQTNKSKILADASLRYDSLVDFNNFINNINIDFNLKPSTIHPNDINYFVNTSKFRVRYPIKLSGEIYGKVKNFNSKNLSFQTASNVIFNGEFSMNGLPNINETFISGKVSRLSIDYSDLQKLAPNLKIPENLKSLGQVKFDGRFDGFIKDFVMNGNFITAVGRATTDLNFKISDDNIPKYSGIIAFKQFDLGKFFNNEQLFGNVTMNVNGTGEGVSLENLDVNLDGEVQEINFKNYSYKNIDINGQVKNKFFEGDLSIDDENLKVDFNGKVNTNSKPFAFAFNADVKHINPQKLNLWNKEAIFSGEVDANFMATNINDVVGDLNIDNLKIATRDKEYNLAHIDLSSRMLVNGEKKITLVSDQVNAFIQGNFELQKIPDAFKSVLLTNFKEKVADQIIKFDIEIKENPELLSLLNPDIKILEKSEIGGNLNSNTNSLLAKIKVPVLKYKTLSIIDYNSNIFIADGNYDVINSVPTIYLKDSVIVKDVSLLINGPRNYLDLKLYGNGIKNTSVELLAKLITKNKRLKIAFEPSNLLINNQFWVIDEDNEINISEKIESKNLRIYNGVSELLINLDLGIENKKADVLLNNIMVEDFTQFLKAKNINLKGVVNGKVGVDVSGEKPGVFGNIMVENIKVNEYKIGNLNANANLDLPNNKVKINANLFGNDNEVDINGTYSFAKNATNKDVDINFDIKNLAIYTVEDFIQEYIDNTKGTVTGKLKLVGYKNKLDLLGYLNINDVTTTVSYLQTTYNIKNHRVEFNKKGIYLGDAIRVTDEDGNEAYGRGWVLHNHLKDFALDIDVTTPKLQGLNTTYDDNKDFYGTAYMKGDVSFKGYTNDITINIKGESESKTEIYIPLDEEGSISNYEFYTFVKKDTSENNKYLDKYKEKFKVNGLTVNLDLTVDQDCELFIILDQTSGDILQVVGDGNVKINVPKEGDVQFYGRYLIADGDYLFTLQNIVNKKFRIQPGSTLSFQGDIEETIVDVDASYNLRAAPEPLIEDYLKASTTIDDQLSSDAKNRIPVSLLLKLSDKLYAPNIDFDIELSQVSPTLKNYTDRKLITLQQYENEMNRQVFGLLVLNQFLPPLSSLDQITNGFNLNVNDAANTVSEFLSNQISRYLNDWLSNFSDNVSFNLNYRNYEQNLAPQGNIEDLALRRELQLALTTRFLQDRIIINVGGNLDFGQNQLGTNNTNTTYLGGNASIEYALTKNKRFRIKTFTITDYDYFYQTNTTRAGIGLSFRREFDNFKDLKIKKDEFLFKNKIDSVN